MHKYFIFISYMLIIFSGKYLHKKAILICILHIFKFDKRKIIEYACFIKINIVRLYEVVKYFKNICSRIFRKIQTIHQRINTYKNEPFTYSKGVVCNIKHHYSLWFCVRQYFFLIENLNEISK